MVLLHHRHLWGPWVVPFPRLMLLHRRHFTVSVSITVTFTVTIDLRLLLKSTPTYLLPQAQRSAQRETHDPFELVGYHWKLLVPEIL